MRKQTNQKAASASIQNLLMYVSTCKVPPEETQMSDWWQHFCYWQDSNQERMVIRLWREGLWTSTRDSWHTVAMVSRYIFKIDKYQMHWHWRKRRILRVVYTARHSWCARTELLFSSPFCNKVIQTHPRVTAHTILHMYLVSTQPGTCCA